MLAPKWGRSSEGKDALPTKKKKAVSHRAVSFNIQLVSPRFSLDISFIFSFINKHTRGGGYKVGAFQRGEKCASYGRKRRREGVSLHTIWFRFIALLWEPISVYCPPPHLQSLPYRNTIARLLRNKRPPHRPPLFMPYTIQYW